MALPKPTPVSVSEINRKAKSLLENQLGEVCVEAEIGTLSRPSSGHWYFSLKDDRAQLSCAMFRRANMRVRFEPKVGDSVIVRGLLSIYEARGNYQLMVDHMEASGDGACSGHSRRLNRSSNQKVCLIRIAKKPFRLIASELCRYVSNGRCGRRHHQRTRSQIALKPYRNLPRSGPRCWLG